MAELNTKKIEDYFGKQYEKDFTKAIEGKLGKTTTSKTPTSKPTTSTGQPITEDQKKYLQKVWKGIENVGQQFTIVFSKAKGTHFAYILIGFDKTMNSGTLSENLTTTGKNISHLKVHLAPLVYEYERKLTKVEKGTDDKKKRDTIKKTTSKLKSIIKQGDLKQLSPEVYYYPITFGQAGITKGDDHQLILLKGNQCKKFLKKISIPTLEGVTSCVLITKPLNGKSILTNIGLNDEWVDEFVKELKNI